MAELIAEIRDALSPASLRPDEISEAGQFLMDGFQLDPRALAFTNDVMRWKYFATIQGERRQPRSFVMRQRNAIVGHIGLNFRQFVVPGRDATHVPTAHPMDWLASASCPSAGIALMLKCFELAPTQYAMGGTEMARRLQSALRFETVANIRVLRRVLRPGHRFREPGYSAGGRLIRFASDCARVAYHAVCGPKASVDAQRVHQFGTEVEQILAVGECNVCFTKRSAGMLNHALVYPGNTFTAWLLRDGPELIGFALLNVVSSAATTDGRIVECFLQRPEARLWRGAVRALTGELHRQGADYASCLASTPWMEEALLANGFAGRNTRQLRIRDPQRTLPAGIAFHATHLEADLGYL